MKKKYTFRCNSKVHSMFTFVCTVSILQLINSFSGKAQVAQNTFRYPAEFEQQQAVWFGWEKEDTALQNTAVKIIRELQGKVPVKMAVDSYESGEDAIEILKKNGIDLDLIEFNFITGDRFWIRDNGAAFVLNNETRLGVIDFQWSSYGYYDWLLTKLPEMSSAINALKDIEQNNDNSQLDQRMAFITGSQLIKSKLVIEGGALETNGKGVLLQCEQVTLQRNPGLTKKQIEEEYRRVLNIKKVIWLKKGTADDGRKFIPYQNYKLTGTGGHLDEFVRFADANTILLGWIDEEDIDKHPLNRITYDRMKENFEILKKSSDQDGKPFRIIKVPLPSIVEFEPEKHTKNTFKDNDFTHLISETENYSDNEMINVATVSYLNFLVTNGMIINASYTNHGTSKQYEERVKAIFKEVFPDREQIWIDVLPLNKYGGGIHCITLHEPLPTKKEKFASLLDY